MYLVPKGLIIVNIFPSKDQSYYFKCQYMNHGRSCFLKKKSKCLSMSAFHKFKTWFPNRKHTIEIYSKKLCGGKKPLQQDEDSCSTIDSLVAMASTNRCNMLNAN